MRCVGQLEGHQRQLGGRNHHPQVQKGIIVIAATKFCRQARDPAEQIANDLGGIFKLRLPRAFVGVMTECMQPVEKLVVIKRHLHGLPSMILAERQIIGEPGQELVMRLAVPEQF